jgi:aminotransferase in exopolysaccharide biosynthesis
MDFLKIVNFIRELFNKPDGIIPLHAPVFRGNERKYIEECIESTFVSSVGKFVDLFEEKIAEYTGTKKAVACVNGTSALHLALKLVGVKPGDEVITQPLTFIATANAISYCGAQQVFLDVDLETMGLSPVKLENWLEHNIIFKHKELETQNLKPFNKVSDKPISACVPMHTFGHPCRIDQIVEICNRYHIPVVEDAAESMGSFYKGQHTGTFGKIGILSFNGNKIIATGGGGMLLFQDETLAKEAKHLTTQAKVPHQWEFAHDAVGYNYRMPNINAALGLAQLELIEKFLASKRKLAGEYENFFDGLKIPFMKEPDNAKSNYWLNCILMNDKNERDMFLSFSNSNNILTRPAWELMNHLPMFRHCETDDLRNATELANRLVNLPSSYRP